MSEPKNPLDKLLEMAAAAHILSMTLESVDSLMSTQGDTIREDYRKRVVQVFGVADKLNLGDAGLPREISLKQKVAMEVAVTIADAAWDGLLLALNEKNDEVEPLLGNVRNATKSRDTRYMVLSVVTQKVLNHLGWHLTLVHRDHP